MEKFDKILEDLTIEGKKIVDTILNKIITSETKVEETKVEENPNIENKIQNKLNDLQKSYEFHIDLLLNDIHEGKAVSDKIVSNIRSLFHSIEHIKDIANK